MKKLALAASALLVLGCGKQANVAHVDGEMRVDLKVLVKNSMTGRGLEGVRVTFFSRRDMTELDLLEREQNAGKVATTTPPRGVTATTDQSGQAMLAGRFDAAFHGGTPSNPKEGEWRPNGSIQFEKAGFGGIRENLEMHLRKMSYKASESPPLIEVELDPLIRLTEVNGFPERFRDAARVVAGAVSSFGAKPDEYFATVLPEPGAGSGKLWFSLRRADSINKIRNADRLGDPFGGSIDAIYDLSARKVTSIHYVR